METSSSVFSDNGIDASVTITNTGSREGSEVVQLYVNDKVSSVSTPVMQLKGFEKITLPPGESRRVSFHLDPADLGLWNPRMQYVTEPGEFELMAGPSSANIATRSTVTYRP